MTTNKQETERFLDAMADIARGLKSLGLNDANTNLGAIELLAKETRDGLADIAEAIRELADTAEDSEPGPYDGYRAKPLAERMAEARRAEDARRAVRS